MKKIIFLISAAMCAAALTVIPQRRPDAAAAVFTARDNGLNLLARCVEAEAKAEPYVVKAAVAAVILNRVRSEKFPDTVSGVIFQPDAFGCVLDGRINSDPSKSAINAARDALNGFDPTNGCLYYFNPAVAEGKWHKGLTVELKIGRYSFARG
jgi:N-acetylmuramoyl-L-alanine amidase